MDDDKGLELSLGLACGGSSSTSKDKSGNPAEVKTETDERTNKILNDFKNFLSAGVPQSFQRNDAVKPQESFFSNLQHTTTNGGSASGDEPVVSDNKRKSVFDDVNNRKKQETGSRNSDLQQERGKTSHISITTDEGSTADNEDVAESEAEGSTSRVISHQEDGSRTPGGSGSSSQAPKELCGNANSITPFSVQTMNVPYSITIKEPSSSSSPSTSTHPLSGMMHGFTSTNGDRLRPHTTTPGSLPMSFGYSPVQIPVLDNKDSSWRMVNHSQPLPSPYGGRSISTSVPMQAVNPHSSESTRPDVRPSELSRGQTPQLMGEEGSSSQVEDDTKGQGISFPTEYPAIKPGIAAEVNFGGSGSFPNLPWVSTTSPGPNSKTISGVTYKYNATQIKIVCACHGVHMSPEEFIQHASEEEQTPVTPSSLASMRNSIPTTSAKS